MQLHFFPFDKQRLRIKAILWGCPEAAGGVTLSEETENEPGGRTIKFEEGANEIYAEGFIQTNAFVLYPNLFLKQGLTRPLYEDQIQYTTLSINCLMERRVNFYFCEFYDCRVHLYPRSHLVSLFYIQTILSRRFSSSACCRWSPSSSQSRILPAG